VAYYSVHKRVLYCC